MTFSPDNHTTGRIITPARWARSRGVRLIGWVKRGSGGWVAYMMDSDGVHLRQVEGGLAHNGTTAAVSRRVAFPQAHLVLHKLQTLFRTCSRRTVGFSFAEFERFQAALSGYLSWLEDKVHELEDQKS